MLVELTIEFIKFTEYMVNIKKLFALYIIAINNLKLTFKKIGHLLWHQNIHYILKR